VDVDAFRVHCPVLQGAQQLEPGPVPDVGQPWIRVRPERALVDTALPGAVENGAPAFQLEHALRRFAGVELSRAPVVEQLAALHRVREVDLPRVLIGDVVHGRRDSAFGHDGVCLAEQ